MGDVVRFWDYAIIRDVSADTDPHDSATVIVLPSVPREQALRPHWRQNVPRETQFWLQPSQK